MRLDDLLLWTSQPYFWFAVALPALLAGIAARLRSQDVRANLDVWLLATTLTIASAYTELRPLIGLAPDPYGVYALPVFPVAYLVAGKYRVASRAVCFAGTFASLLATDLIVFAQRWLAGSADAGDTLVGIGAGRPIDGHLVAPVGAWVTAWLVAGLQRRGTPLRMFRSRLR